MMMKIIQILTMLSIAAGCTSEKIQVINVDGGNSDQRMQSSFSDEKYIWEFWSFSTNRVNGVK